MNYLLDYDSTADQFRFKGPTWDLRVSRPATGVTANEWNHFAAVVSVGSSQARFYVNGVLLGTSPVTGTITTNAYDLTVGAVVFNDASPTPGRLLQGSIDDVRVFKRSITAADILELRDDPYDPQTIPEQNVSVYTEILPQGLWKASGIGSLKGAYIFGGLNTMGAIQDHVVHWDPALQDAKTTGVKLPVAVHSSSAVWSKGAALVFGGTTSSGASASIIWYQPTNDGNGASFFANASLPSPRTATSAVWTGQYAYIFGGYWTGYLDQIVRYNPADDSVTILPEKLPSPRNRTSAVWTGTDVYIFGGWNGAPLNEIVRYNPATGLVVVMPVTLPTGLHSSAAVWTGSKAVVLGGRNSTEASRKIFVYDPEAAILETAKGVLDGRREAPVAAWMGDHVDLFGGKNNSATPSRWIMRVQPAAFTTDIGPEPPRGDELCRVSLDDLERFDVVSVTENGTPAPDLPSNVANATWTLQDYLCVYPEAALAPDLQEPQELQLTDAAFRQSFFGEFLNWSMSQPHPIDPVAFQNALAANVTRGDYAAVCQQLVP